MPLTTEFLFGLKKNAPKSLASSVWQLIVKLKINKKRKTRRGTRAGTDTRQKTSYKIPSITSDPLLAQTNKLHLAQNRSTKTLDLSTTKLWQYPILFFPKILIFVQLLKHGLQTTPHQQC